MTPDAIESFLSQRVAALLGKTEPSSHAQVLYWSNGAYQVMEPSDTTAHFFEMSVYLKNAGVDRIDWEVLDSRTRGNEEQLIEVVYSHFVRDRLHHNSVVTYYFRPDGDEWRLKLVEIEQSQAWDAARRALAAQSLSKSH